MRKARIIIASLILTALFAVKAQAITLNSLTGATDPTGRSDAYTTASITITANRLALLCVEGGTSAATSIVTPIIGGTLSATWVLVDQIQHNTLASGSAFLFRTMVGSNQTGTITIDPDGETWTSAEWSVVEFSNVSTEGTNGSGAVVQAVKNKTATGTSWTPSPALSTFGHADNRPYVCAGGRMGSDRDFVASDGATEIHDLDTGLAPQLFTMWDAATADTTPTFTWTTSDNDLGGIAVEIKSSTAVTTSKPKVIIIE